jgi:putative peptidoglycan lipid II flippase
MLYRALRKNGFYTPQPGWPIFLLKVVASVGLMACVVFTAMGEARWWLSAPWQLKLPAVLGVSLLGAAAYAACLAAFGFRLRDFSRRGAG